MFHILGVFLLSHLEPMTKKFFNDRFICSSSFLFI